MGEKCLTRKMMNVCEWNTQLTLNIWGLHVYRVWQMARSMHVKDFQQIVISINSLDEVVSRAYRFLCFWIKQDIRPFAYHNLIFYVHNLSSTYYGHQYAKCWWNTKLLIWRWAQIHWSYTTFVCARNTK